jgi:lipoate-protein ligase A
VVNDGADILAGDMALFRAVESGAADRLYHCWHTSRPIVVAGRFRQLADDVLEDACRADGVPVIHRESGGGTVILGAGCLNYALAVANVSRPEFADVAASFEVILEAIAAALGVPGLVRAGTDLALDGRKVGGSAQRRGRRALLHHGTLLCGFSPAVATRYLREPARQPAYREGRRHADFLGSIPVDEAELRTRLERALAGL